MVYLGEFQVFKGQVSQLFNDLVFRKAIVLEVLK
jgi:hypothetical protein